MNFDSSCLGLIRDERENAVEIPGRFDGNERPAPSTGLLERAIPTNYHTRVEGYVNIFKIPDTFV